MAKPVEVEVERAVAKFLTGDLRTQRAFERAERLAQTHGDRFYAELLWALAHLRFDEKAARRHWAQLTLLQAQMSKKLKGQVDLRVALVDYFLQVNRKLKNPTIIELKLFQQTQASVYRDALTGLYNYRYLLEHLPREVARVERHDSALSLIMFDLDDFKQFNDRHGHAAGNKALAAVGKILTTGLRRTDVAARYGGEEFCIVLSSTPKDKALQLAEKLRSRIAEHFAGAGQAVTVSGGIATHPIDGLDDGALLKAADQALYVAKSRGKNQVFLFGDDRRSFKRVTVPVDGVYRSFSLELQPLRCLDISEGGMLFGTQERLPLASLLDVQLTLPEVAGPLSLVGRVIRVEEREGQFQTGLTFVNLSDLSRRQLIKFLRAHRSAE